MPAALTKVRTALALSHTRSDTALTTDGHLILAACLRPVSVPHVPTTKALSELAIFEICHCIFSIGDVLGEEVMKVVVDQRIVDTAGVAKGREEEEGKDEVAESVSFSWRWRWSRRWASLRAAGTGRWQVTCVGRRCRRFRLHVGGRRRFWWYSAGWNMGFVCAGGCSIQNRRLRNASRSSALRTR